MASEALTADDRALARAALRATSPLSDDDLAALEPCLRVRRLATQQLFLRCGEPAVDCAVVVAGLTREYFPLADGREVTRGFAGPGSFVGSLSDLLSGEPAKSAAIAEAATRLVVMPWRKICELTAERPAWAQLIHRITQRLYLAKAAREYELLALDAEARYLRFRALYAEREPMIALRHVASYVGITPEHLSRLRRRLGISGAGASTLRSARASRR
jgi:CRP-like cAMP-binding protein